MVIIREATENDKEGWNKVASQSEYGTYAHTWEWADVIENGLDIKAVKLIAEIDEQIVGIYSGFLKKGKHNVLFSPIDITWDYGGPVIKNTTEDNIIGLMLNEMEKMAKKHDCVSLRISPFAGYKHITALSEYRIVERLTMMIDLSLTTEELWSNVKKNARRYINKPKEAGIQIIEDNSLEGILKLHEILVKFFSEMEIPVPPQQFFKEIHNTLIPKKMASVHLVQYENKIIGGGLSFMVGKTVTFRYAAISKDYKDTYAHYLLHWNRILNFRNKGFDQVDMGGISSDEKSGIYFFKSRFGGKVVNVDWFVKDIYLPKIRAIKRKMKSN